MARTISSAAAGLVAEGDVVAGDALDDYREVLLATGARETPPALWRPSAVHIARLGTEILQERGPADVHALSPLYLRRPPGG